MEVLKPVDQLICSIQHVFASPGTFGVTVHDYFNGWTTILPSDIGGNSIDDDKLKKVIRKCRFFLHPDKLPNDLADDQQFMCRLLWDVINDAYENYKKTNDHLDWL